ncbi:MAG TPA: class I SAM-dependent methyltransferase [Mycobacterium sp.]|nr:class I SAM-dependent methyltransferase [Mycobacterium sp.]
MTPTERISDVGVKSFKAFMSKVWYPFLTRRLNAQDVTCLNYGYEEDPPLGIPLEAADEQNRYGIQLYRSVATQVDLEGKDVLEVSCGHGGGASYLTRNVHPASYTGLDFNPDGIAYCQRKHQLQGLRFVHGDAEQLPFDDESFDAVINVEASHAYPQLSRFLAEVVRVLRPGGHFLYADFRGQSEFAEWDAALAAMPLRQVSQRVINDNVIRSLDKNSQRSLELIGGQLPAIFRPFGRRFAGVPGTGLYRVLQAGTAEYRIYCFAKD